MPSTYSSSQSSGNRCRNCQQPVAPQTKFCPNYGATVDPSAPAAQPQAACSGKGRLGPILSAAILGIGLALTVAFVLFSRQARDRSPVGGAPPTPAPTDNASITSHAVRQPVDFHFKFGSASLDPKALNDAEPMARYLHDLHYERCHVVSRGFADNKSSASRNKTLSEEQARAVSAEPERQGAAAVEMSAWAPRCPSRATIPLRAAKKIAASRFG